MKFYKKFTFKVTVRILLILCVMLALAYIFGDQRLVFNQIILALVLILQVAELLKFINRTNRELAKFLLAIKHKDFSINFNQSKIGASFDELNEAFTEIIATYKEAKLETEGQFHYLKMVVSNINIGILSLENNEDIVLTNQSAEQVLNVKGIRNWRILENKYPSFVNKINTLGDHGRQLIDIDVQGEQRTLSVDVNSMVMLNKTYKLITFQDIKSEIEQTEIEAWHKLIRILTHEIMNSATPISSLTETMHMMLEKDGKQKPVAELNEEVIEDLIFSLKTIKKRSDGMVAFIDDYRKLTKVAQPKLHKVMVQELFDTIYHLMSGELEKNDIAFEAKVENIETIQMDTHLIEQVIINLVTNCIHALEGVPYPQVSLYAYKDHGKAVIKVSDNGCGIPKKELGQIFIPFFSTKKQGSGVGLSLSKQIMHLHHGYIKVQSEVDKGTAISLFFPKT